MLRTIRRNAIKFAMKKQGLSKICKHNGHRGHGSKAMRKNDSGYRSYFASHWRDYK